MTFDPATVAAFVDGELDEMTAQRIAREAAGDPALAAAIARHRALKARLTAHYAPVLDEALPERLTALVAGASQIDTSLSARREAKRLRFAPAHWGAVAAALLLGLSVGMRPWAPAGPVAVEDGALVAAGSLAGALDTQLASNQAADAPVRIGMTFRDEAGRWCRSFESAALDGVGCHAGDGWRLERTMPGSATTDYRQASSGELAGAVAAMMAGDALGAAEEKAVRDAGWGTAP